MQYCVSNYLHRRGTSEKTSIKSDVKKSINIFKSNILKLIWPKPNSVYYCHNLKEISLMARLCLGLSNRCKHKFKHSFQDCLNLICFSGNDVETSTHDLLHSST